MPIYSPGEALQWQIEIANSTKQEITGTTIHWRIDSWSGEEFRKTEPVALLPSATVSQVLPYRTDKLGWFEMVAEVARGDDKPVAEIRHRFAVIQPAKSKGTFFRYGICAHTAWRKGTDYEKEFALMDRLGVDIVRDAPMEWASIQPDKGTWRFERADRYVEETRRIGIDLLSLFGDNTKWASTGDINHPKSTMWTRVVPQREAVVEFATTLAARYKGKVTYWEYCNEEDIGWNSPPDQYAETLNAVFAALRTGNPEAQGMNGGFAAVKRNPYPAFVETAVPLIDQGLWRIFAYHDYNTFENMITRYREVIRPVYDKAGLKIPIWINEGGFNQLLPGGGERQQGLELAKKYVSAPWLGVGSYFWYDLRDDGEDPANKEHHFGLVSPNFEPKPAFAIYQTVIRELSNLRYTGTLEGKAPSDVRSFVYRQPDGGEGRQDTLVIWRNGEQKSPFLVKVGRGTIVTGADDLMGNPLSFETVPEGLVMTLGTEPVYLHLRGDARETEVQSLVETPSSIVIIPGKPAVVPVTVRNPLSRDSQPILEATAPDLPGSVWSFSDTRVLSKSGGQAELKLSATVSPEDAAWVPWDKKIQAHLAITFSGDKPLKIQSEVPCELALEIPRATDLVPAPALLFDLHSGDSIYNLYSAELKRQTEWSGANDLSATARLVYDDQFLRIEVQAVDDVHVQDHLDQALQNGDSLQVELSLLGQPASLLRLGLALKTDGTSGGWVYTRGAESSLSPGALPSGIVPFTVTRKNDATSYRLSIPWTALGLKGPPVEAIRFNFYVNDNDNVGGRKQWLRLTGDASGTRNPAVNRVLYCR